MKLLLMYKQPLSLKHMESPNTKKNKNIAQIQVGVHLFLMNINFFFFFLKEENLGVLVENKNATLYKQNVIQAC